MSKRLICDVGINDADYIIKTSYRYKDKDGKIRNKLIWQCPIYACWKRMIERVYDKNYLKKRPSYEEVTICDAWLRFSNFKAWVISLDYDITGLVLDKDILSWGLKKKYCPEFAAFVTKTANSFILDFGNNAAKFVRKRTENCYEARVSNPLTGKEITYYSNNYLDCKNFAINTKIKIAEEIAQNEVDPRVKEKLPQIYKEKYYV